MNLSSRILKEQLKNNSLSHAYLLVSRNKEILENESKALIYNIYNGEDNSSEKFLRDANVDFFKVEPEKNNIKIGQVREIIEFLSSGPVESKYKVVLIKNAEFFRKESANALLKILEEPPKYGKIILTTDNEEKIIKTIISRCQVINLEHSVEIAYEDYAELNKILVNSINRNLLELSNSKEYFFNNKEKANEIYNYFYNFFYDLYKYGNSKIKDNLIYKDNIKIYEDINKFKNENLINILDKIMYIKDKFKNNVNFQLSNEELLLYIMEEQK
ncbi:DNA polymerase III subunit delta' C-terminal domain-containing protein [Miniphocaeibacter massiliensis]|uniref:DNA polymerase III subunit delta' C-terminal domain-containing protein n=1 Tax=Miniphocaeibacter massiliensis TaxID=2041841 RepID=UPI000C070353|nr:DNA polymerase III subunit delta' C-terminal domain-containing protein [Miniphocaeibacter massiliensis]